MLSRHNGEKKGQREKKNKGTVIILLEQRHARVTLKTRECGEKGRRKKGRFGKKRWPKTGEGHVKKGKNGTSEGGPKTIARD